MKMFPATRSLLTVIGLATVLLLPPGRSSAAEETISQKLISSLLADNQAWLCPQPKKLGYTFHMKHTDPSEDDLNSVVVRYEAPNRVNFTEGKGAKEQELDNEYDPGNSAYAPRLQTVLQGITLFGPLQELSLAPADHRMAEVGQETVAGRSARVLQLVPAGQPGEKAVARYEEEVRTAATRQRSMYLLEPVVRSSDGTTRAVIQARCLFEEGPQWKRIQDDLAKDPTRVRWEPTAPRGTIRMERQTVRALLLRTNDGNLPVLLYGQRAPDLRPQLLLSEGDSVVDEGLAECLRDSVEKPVRCLAMRIGCGIGHLWYGYSGGGASTDKIWVDRETGAILREEGTSDSGTSFKTEYSDFETSGDKQVPLRIVVHLPDVGGMKWDFDMTFSTHGGKTWLLKELCEYHNGNEAAKAWITDVSIEPR